MESTRLFHMPPLATYGFKKLAQLVAGQVMVDESV